MNTTAIPRKLTVREQAEQEVREERANACKGKMKQLLRQRADAQQVLNGIELQIADFEKQIEDGTAG